MEQENIISKIKKLLTMAERGTVHEREIAYFKSQEMMAKYHIDRSQVIAQVEQEKVVRIPVDDINVKKAWYNQLAIVIAANFRCKTYVTYSSKKWLTPVFMGMEVDAAVAVEIFKNAYTFARRESRLVANYYYTRTGTSEGVRGEWMIGFIKGIKDGFEAQIIKSTTTALMIIIPPMVEEEYNQIKFSKAEVSFENFSRNGSAALNRAGYQNGYDFSMGRRQAALAGSED